MDRKVKKIEPTLPERPKALRVAAYARVSTAKDEMLHSLSAQISYYSNLIQKHKGWIYVGVYSDEAKTGTKDNRPGFQRLITDCRAGKIDTVLVKSISRFARNTVTLLESIRELKGYNIDVFFEEQNIHTLSNEGELMLTILASFAQAESLSASENQKWIVRNKFMKGEIVNLRHLFGYEISKDGIRVNEEEAELVKKMFEMYAEGISIREITVYANESGLHPLFSNEWIPTKVRRILANEKFSGNSLFQKKYRNNHIEKREIPNRGELEKYYAEETHERIVDDDIFKIVQDRIIATSQPFRNRYKGLFSSKIICGNCGKVFKRCISRGNHFYNCSTYVREGKSKCKSCRLPEDTIYDITSEILGIEELTPEIIQKNIKRIIAADFTLRFEMSDGREIERKWELKSRAESWTPEMKEAARKAAIEGWKKNGKCYSNTSD